MVLSRVHPDGDTETMEPHWSGRAHQGCIHGDQTQWVRLGPLISPDKAQLTLLLRCSV